MGHLGATLVLAVLLPGAGEEDVSAYLTRWECEVSRRKEFSVAERQVYADYLATVGELEPGEFVLVADRNRRVQAILLYWQAPDGRFHFIGGSPVSTGRPGRFDYFETPVGVFTHMVANPDYRALGTKNEYGVRGYGVKGMRVYDFGWVQAPKGWGDGGEIAMRLQMHATDPGRLERRLGERQSKGCVRIPATLNVFLDRHGILDADYRRAAAEGRRPVVLRPDWNPSRWAGRHLVVVDTSGVWLRR
jgi:hypothetical protein